ncbi:MAG: hypothetical protein Fur0010_14540 [Bdellovibrio sp.]
MSSPNSNIPDFYNAKFSVYFDDDRFMQLFIDIDKKDRIAQIGYSLSFDSPWALHFEKFCSFAKGKNVQTVLAHDWAEEFSWKDENVPLINFPHLLLHQAWHQFIGTPISCEIQRQDPKDLLCRCFGVYRSQLMELALKESIKNVEAFLQVTMAGQGCGSCRSEVEAIYFQQQKTFEAENNKNRIMGLTNAEFLMKVDDDISEWLKREKVQNRLSIAPIVVAADTLIVKIEPKEAALKLIPSLRDFLTEKGVPQYLKIAVR